MDVLSYLPPLLLARLRVALGQEHRLLAADGWAGLDLLARRNVVTVAVLDPLCDGGDGVESVCDFMARHPSVPVVLYVVLSPASLRAVVRLARHGVQTVVLHQFDDDPRRLRELLERQPGDALTELLLHELAEPLRRLSPGLAEAVREMFRQPHRVWTAQDLATAAGLPRRTMYRQLETAGFASPRLLVQGARLLRAYLYLRNPGNLIEDVVAKLRYGSPHVFIRHTREACGLTPSALRRGVDEPDFVALLTQRLLAG
ncbi:MAG TPA: AraC family transcriptional regulator [Gemmatimonadaceae bacterium]|nr:AraC family transcriptional regulator [Gemmatimonadaceae bacterium]